MTKICAFVCIRFNNSRLPGKNTKILNDKHLCYWIFDKLNHIKGLSRICVYCSDRSVIEMIPDNIEFIQRDKYYDQDIPCVELLQSFSKLVDSDYYLLCHATCPFLKVSTIQKTIDMFNPEKYDSAFTCKKYQTFLWSDKSPINFELDNIPRTQDLEPFYIENVGAYLYSKREILENNRRIGDKPLKIPVSEIECVDIDNPEDYEFAIQLENLMELTYQ